MQCPHLFCWPSEYFQWISSFSLEFFNLNIQYINPKRYWRIQRLVLVNLPASKLPVLTKEGIVWPSSFFLSSVCSENFSSLKLALSLSFTALVWVATLRTTFIFPEDSVVNKYLFIGPIWSISFSFSDLEISYIFLMFIRPPKKNSDILDFRSTFGFQVSTSSS